ncbi:hypothetical protein SAMN02745158_02850 [Lactonifactor longoviformis DSM 17459]|uniref:Uncharacterized protein n=1 Tax=Lactonifactor longoviformis DSM 17459 TaxID=1122155 RepID=A0A1M4ZPL6_9CLOT|nr:hypothetical protein SAMN02745158_02850 [Lactonifactor longoviformis DSM 17459]
MDNLIEVCGRKTGCGREQRDETAVKDTAAKREMICREEG